MTQWTLEALRKRSDGMGWERSRCDGDGGDERSSCGCCPSLGFVLYARFLSPTVVARAFESGTVATKHVYGLWSLTDTDPPRSRVLDSSYLAPVPPRPDNVEPPLRTITRPAGDVAWIADSQPYTVHTPFPQITRRRPTRNQGTPQIDGGGGVGGGGNCEFQREQHSPFRPPRGSDRMRRAR